MQRIDSVKTLEPEALPEAGPTFELQAAQLDQARRRNNFDLLRFFFAALVVYSHSYPLGAGAFATEPLHRLSDGQATLGDLAVNAFFVISGFLITASYERSKGLFDYAHKRVCRIYPGFIVANLIGTFVVLRFALPQGVPFPDINPLQYSLDTIRLIGFNTPEAFAENIYRVGDGGVLNGSLWSIPYESWCYVGVAILGICSLLVRPRVMLGLFIFSLALAALFAYRDLTWFRGGPFTATFGHPHNWARLLPFYMAGVVAYRYRHRLHSRDTLALIALLSLVITAYFKGTWSVVLPVAGSYLIFWFAFHERWHFPNFARFGDFSYGLYLYAFPIQQLVVHYYGGSMSPIKLCLLSLPPSIIAGMLSWFLVERWFLSRRGRKPSKARASIEELATKPA